MTQIQLFDIPIENVTLTEAVEQIIDALNHKGTARVYFVNAHCVNIARKNSDYKQILQQGDKVFADGSGMRIAAKLLGKPLVDNVNGTDLYPVLSQRLRNTDKRVFLLGAEPGTAELMKDCAMRDYPGVSIVGTQDGFYKEHEIENVLSDIRESQADLLLVAMGVPQQEEWLKQHLSQAGAKVGIGVGGLFNFYSGRIPRAPMWVRRLGLEWLHRMAQEPSRLWRRYLIGNIIFLMAVLGEFIKSKRSN